MLMMSRDFHQHILFILPTILFFPCWHHTVYSFLAIVQLIHSTILRLIVIPYPITSYHDPLFSFLILLFFIIPILKIQTFRPFSKDHDVYEILEKS